MIPLCDNQDRRPVSKTQGVPVMKYVSIAVSAAVCCLALTLSGCGERQADEPEPAPDVLTGDAGGEGDVCGTLVGLVCEGPVRLCRKFVQRSTILFAGATELPTVTPARPTEHACLLITKANAEFASRVRVVMSGLAQAPKAVCCPDQCDRGPTGRFAISTIDARPRWQASRGFRPLSYHRHVYSRSASRGETAPARDRRGP